MILHCHYYSQTEHLFLLSDLREYYESQQLFSCNQTPSSSSNSQNLQSPIKTHTPHHEHIQTIKRPETRHKREIKVTLTALLTA